MSRVPRYIVLIFGAFAAWLILSCLALSLTALVKPNPSYTQFGHSINVGPTDEVGDLTCFGCSIHVRGLVAGDVTAFGGTVILEDQAQVAGDVAVFAGDLRLIKGVKVSGDAAVFGGEMHRDLEA